MTQDHPERMDRPRGIGLHAKLVEVPPRRVGRSVHEEGSVAIRSRSGRCLPADRRHHQPTTNEAMAIVADGRVRGPRSPMTPAPTVAHATPRPMRTFVGPTGSVSRRSRCRAQAVAAASRPVTPSTAANHAGRVSHHPAEKRTGAHRPAASAAAQSASAERCHAYTATDASPALVEQPSPACVDPIEPAGDHHQHADLQHAGDGGEQPGRGRVRPLTLDGIDQRRVVSSEDHQGERTHRRDHDERRPRASLVLPPGLPSQPPPRADQPGHPPRQEEPGPPDRLRRPESESSEVERGEHGKAGAHRCNGVFRQPCDARTQARPGARTRRGTTRAASRCVRRRPRRLLRPGPGSRRCSSSTTARRPRRRARRGCAAGVQRISVSTSHWPTRRPRRTRASAPARRATRNRDGARADWRL